MAEKKQHEEQYYCRLFAHIRKRIQAAVDKKIGELREELDSEIKELGIFSVSLAGQGTIIPVEYLCQIFRCTRFERLCLLTALAIELEPDMKSSFGNNYPTLDQCLKLYTNQFAEKVELLQQSYERSTMMRWLFYFQEDKNGWLEQRVFPEQRIRDFCLGNISGLLPGITYMRLFLPDTETDEQLLFHREQIEKISRYRQEIEKPCLFYLCGPYGIGKEFAVKYLASEWGCPVVFADLGKMSSNEKEFRQQLEQVEKETMLQGGISVFSHFEILQKSAVGEEDEESRKKRLRILADELVKYRDSLFVLSEQSLRQERECFTNDICELELKPLSYQERLVFWKYQMERELPEEEMAMESLASRYPFTPLQIKRSIEAAEEALLFTDRKLEDVIYTACQNQVSFHMEDIAEPIRAAQDFEDLILPSYTKNKLISAIHQIEYQEFVYESWGFEKKVMYGRGVSLLFYGPPGTGKTMGASVIAKKLHMELYRVDLSAIMSKYIGETEKNIKRVFDAVKGTKSILFFDEADALFGKRSEVTDAQDKYANAETAYLLQKMEDYDGVVILATNYLQNFDRAFLRRIKFVLEFPFPQPKERLQIWKNVFPAQAPVDETLDFDFLAEQFELSGSSIKNAAVSAAFCAAAAGEKISMQQIIPAVKEEFEKAGRITNIADYGQYGYLLRE